MAENYYDIIIIGSGISGLYSAYNIQKISPKTSFLILEKHKKQWIGGRTSNETFYGTEVVTGAGIGRKDTNPLLINLLHELDIDYSEYQSVISYSKLLEPLDIVKIINKLKVEYREQPELRNKTFKDFFIKVLGPRLYKKFILTAGYTDYENADTHETLYNYGMDDNTGGWTGLHIPWKKLVDTLYHKIGGAHFHFSRDVVSIKKIQKDPNPCLFEIKTANGQVYHCNKVIMATTITGIQQLIGFPIYKQIHGQPFLRLYGKFDKKSALVMKHYVPNYTVVPGPLQKIIPMNSSKGVYMIAYSDNKNALILKNHLKNTTENRKLFCELIEKSLGIPEGSLQLTEIRDYYWAVGTHYYDPLSNEFSCRNAFVRKAQHPTMGLIVVGEVVSRYQGWVEGALESVQTALTKKWIVTGC